MSSQALHNVTLPTTTVDTIKNPSVPTSPAVITDEESDFITEPCLPEDTAIGDVTPYSSALREDILVTSSLNNLDPVVHNAPLKSVNLHSIKISTFLDVDHVQVCDNHYIKEAAPTITHHINHVERLTDDPIINGCGHLYDGSQVTQKIK